MDNTTNGAEDETKRLVHSGGWRIFKEQKDFLEKLKELEINPSQWVRAAIDERRERLRHKYPFLKDESETDKAA